MALFLFFVCPLMVCLTHLYSLPGTNSLKEPNVASTANMTIEKPPHNHSMSIIIKGSKPYSIGPTKE